MKKIEMVGKRFGKLVVLQKAESLKEARWKCKCDCGKEHEASGSHLRQGHIQHCGCVRILGEKHHQWTGVGEISGAHWYNIVIRSASKNRRKKEVTITIKEAWDLFLKQDRKCALSGLTLNFPKKWKDKFTASLDRIDSSKDYSLDNVQWVHKHINIMKNIYNNDYFIDMCKLISNNHKE